VADPAAATRLSRDGEAAASATPAEPAKGRAALAEAWRFAWANPGLRRTLWVFVATMVLVMPAAQLAPIVVVQLWGSQTWMLAAVEVGYSAAMLAGGAILTAWGGLRNRMTMILTGSFIWGALTLIQGLTPWSLVYIASWIPFGLAGPLMETTPMTVVQEATPPHLMGRLMGLIQLMMAVTMPVGLLVAAPMMDWVGPRPVIVVSGALGVLATVVLTRRAPKVLKPGLPTTD
jgi:DHA3 family macrolide efflux protein-like MFS transporter